MSQTRRPIEPRRTLALGRANAPFYRSISHVLHHFGEITFFDERRLRSGAEILTVVKRDGIDRVLMPNPYGNEKRLGAYRALRAGGIPVIASDRGALPGSWFFDHGFNVDSPSYEPGQWDRPLGVTEASATRDYLASLRRSDSALEAQGPRRAPEALREELGLERSRVLFVPLQRPNDTVVRYFAGPVGSLAGFERLVREVADALDSERGWTIVVKPHPLEPAHERLAHPRIRGAAHAVHVHDLLALADAVLVLNSGVGLLSLCFGKPTLHVGDAFYGHPGLAVQARTAPEVIERLREGAAPSGEKVERFVHHLTQRVYSFGALETRLRRNRDGSTERITTHLELRSLRILGEDVPLRGDRVLVVSPVVPGLGRRGSETRVDGMLRALVALGKSVSLAVLVSSTERATAEEMICELRRAHPALELVEIAPHPSLDRSPLGRVRRGALALADVLTGGAQRVDRLSACPPSFRRRVRRMCERLRPHVLFVNYAKLAPVVPSDFEGIKVVDAHDHQTRLLEEDRRRGRRRHVLPALFGRSEARALGGFDRILAINESEQPALERLAPSSRVHVIPAFVDAPPSGPAPAPRHDALLVASLSAFNVDGLLWFATEALPRIRERRPGFELVVAGNIDRAKPLRGRRLEGVRFLGVVPELAPVYAASSCVLAPLLGGAGMKIKVVEALAHGKAIVATPAALEGIHAVDGEHLLAAGSATELAEAVLRVLSDDPLRARLEAGAKALHARDHSPASAERALARALER